MVTDIRGGIKACTLRIIRKTAHDCVQIAASFKVHVGGIAVISKAFVFIVAHPRGVLGEGNEGV